MADIHRIQNRSMTSLSDAIDAVRKQMPEIIPELDILMQIPSLSKQVLETRHDRPRFNRLYRNPAQFPSLVYVVGIMESGLSWPEVFNYFQGFGKVEASFMSREWATSCGSLGSCFLQFVRSDSARLAVDLNFVDNGHIIRGMRYFVQWVINHSSGRRVVLQGLPLHTCRKALQGYFQQFGRIMECLVHRPKGWLCCLGFIEFQMEQSAAMACFLRFHYLNGQRFECLKVILEGQGLDKPTNLNQLAVAYEDALVSKMQLQMLHLIETGGLEGAAVYRRNQTVVIDGASGSMPNPTHPWTPLAPKTCSSCPELKGRRSSV